MRIASRRKYGLKESTNHQTYRNKLGVIVPSVTAILKVISKDSLVGWANSLGWKRMSVSKELDKASKIGNLAHAYADGVLFRDEELVNDIYNEINWAPEEIKEKALNCIHSFDQWYNENKNDIKPISYETQMSTDSYGGTCDFICLYKDKLTIFDFKTSSDFHPTMYMQLSAYCKMYEYNHPEDKVCDVGVLRMDKKYGTKAIYKSISDIPNGSIGYYYKAFEHALALSYYMRVIEKDFS